MTRTDGFLLILLIAALAVAVVTETNGFADLFERAEW